MDRTLFFDGMDVLEEDLDNVEVTKVAAIQRTRTDIATQTGIMFGLVVTNPIAFQLSVTSGVAYNSNGEALVQAITQTLAIGFGDVGFYLVIQHTQTDGTFVEHPITGILNATRRVDGTQLAMTAAPIATDVVLAQLTALSGGGTATLDVDEAPVGPRVFWSARVARATITDDMLDPNGDVIIHINSFGTGIVSPTNPHGLSPADIGFVADSTPVTHQLKDHSNGVEPDSNAAAALVTVNAATAPDQATIVQIVAGDSILINGNRFQPPALIAPAVLTFLDAGVNPELWEIGITELGVASKTLRAQYTAAKLVTGVQLVDVSPTHSVGNFTLAYNGFGTLTYDNNNIGQSAYQSGSVSLGDGFVFIRRETDPNQWILLWVDVSALPGGAQTDTITINSPSESDARFLLATLPWSGSASGFLGYGDNAASGVAYDKRARGNIATRDVGTSAIKDLIQTYFSETRGDGHASKGYASNGGGLNVDIEGGIAYVNGKRIVYPRQSIVMLDNTTSYLYVDDQGVIRFPTSFPFAWGFRSRTRFFSGSTSSAGQLRAAPIATVVTLGGIVTTITDARVILADSADALGYTQQLLWTTPPPGTLQAGVAFLSPTVLRSLAIVIGSNYQTPAGIWPERKRIFSIFIKLFANLGETATAKLQRSNGDGSQTTILTINVIGTGTWAFHIAFMPLNTFESIGTEQAYFWDIDFNFINMDLSNMGISVIEPASGYYT